MVKFNTVLFNTYFTCPVIEVFILLFALSPRILRGILLILLLCCALCTVIFLVESKGRKFEFNFAAE